MIQNIFKLCLFSSLLFLFSCEEDKLMLYGDTDSQGDAQKATTNVYFLAKKWIDTSTNSLAASLRTVELGFQDGNDSVYVKTTILPTSAVDIMPYSFAEVMGDSLYAFVPVAIMGALASEDRPLNYEIITDSDSAAVEGVDFKILASYIPANKTTGGIVVKFFRKNLTEQEDKMLTIDFRLLPNDHFKTEYNEATRSRNSDDIVDPTEMITTFEEGWAKPVYWDSRNAPVFGKWSVKKAMILIYELGIPSDWILDEIAIPSMKGPLGELFKQYLQDMKDKGQTVYENDGTEMSTEL